MAACDCHVQVNKILPQPEDLLRFMKKKMLDHEILGQVHERLIKVVKNLTTVDSFTDQSHPFKIFNDPEEYEDALQGCHYLYGAEHLESSREECASTAK
jgi:hypothetical protein